MRYSHIPVLLNEVISELDPRPGEFYIDCTLGGGGYSSALLDRVGAEGGVLAIDLDPMAIRNAGEKFKNKTNIKIANGNFNEVQKILLQNRPDQDGQVSGIVFDLGLSSAQLQDRDRGFSFQFSAPLDMRFGSERHRGAQNETETETQQIVDGASERDLTRIFREYGEEKYAAQIAKKIVLTRNNHKIKTTGELVEVIASAVPGEYRNNKKIHFATRVFQALRIETNQELHSLEKALPQALAVLRPGGRIAVISYHSLEDRIVKNFFRRESKDCLCPPEFPVCVCGHHARVRLSTSKAIIPSEEEIKENPRARSAKLRVAEKVL